MGLSVVGDAVRCGAVRCCFARPSQTDAAASKRAFRIDLAAARRGSESFTPKPRRSHRRPRRLRICHTSALRLGDDSRALHYHRIRLRHSCDPCVANGKPPPGCPAQPPRVDVPTPPSGPPGLRSRSASTGATLQLTFESTRDTTCDATLTPRVLP